MPPQAKLKTYTYAIGRRKSATARVRVYQKKTDNLINSLSVSQYFPSLIDRQLLLRPFTITATQEKYSFTVRVAGSGKKSQRDAIVHGLSRALVKIDADSFHSLLKKAGLLTRDPRMKESRKVGTGGKARRRKQSPKR